MPRLHPRHLTHLHHQILHDRPMRQPRSLVSLLVLGRDVHAEDGAGPLFGSEEE